MLQPPEWRIHPTDEFEAEFEALAAVAERLDAHRRAWYFYLQRVPISYSKGLTAPDDDDRVLVTPDVREGVEFVVGLTVDQRRQVVRLNWLDSRELP
jgi:hypothetical protein